MPRKIIDLPYHIEHLSILDQKGHLDRVLEPAMDGELLTALHRCMLLSRRFDERMLSLQRQGRIGTFAPIKGQEAAQLGSAAVLREPDWLVPSFREMAAEIWHGKSLESILLVYSGYNEGGILPENQRTLPVSIPVGTHLPHAVGLGYAAKYRKRDEIVMTFFGDGATSEGDFHEALNFAAVFQTPTIFVCQNNQWAISVPRRKQTRSATLAQKALAYGMPGIQVDGNDILAVYVAAKEAADRARAGQGPTLIECITYRLSLHTTADDPKRYRTEEEVVEWSKRDPLRRFQMYLQQRGMVSQNEIEILDAEIKVQIQKAVDHWEQMRKDFGEPKEMFRHVFEEMPESLKEQMKE